MNQKTNTIYRRRAGRGTSSSATITCLVQLAVFSVVVAVTLTSCQSFSSEAVTDNNTQVQSGIGLLYYLPQGRVHIVGAFSSGSAGNPGGGGTNNGTGDGSDVAKTNVSPELASPPVDSTQVASTGIPPRPTAKGPLNPSLPTNTGSPGSSAQGSGQGAYTVSITGDLIADPTTNYLLSPAHDYMADDASHLIVSGKGLLSSTAATNTDETAAIFTNAVALASLVGGLNGAPPPMIVPFDVYFDPTSQSDVARAEEVIHEASNNKLSLTVTPVPTTRPANFTLPHQHDGVLYRRLLPYHMSVSGDFTSTFSIDAQQDVLLPDKKTLFCMEYNRISFVQKVESVTFTNGVPIEYSENIPSPVLGLMAIPKSIIQSLIMPAGTPAASGVASKSTTATSKN